MKVIYVDSKDVPKLLKLIVTAFNDEMFWDFRAYNDWCIRPNLSSLIAIHKEVIMTNEMKELIDNNYEDLVIFFLTTYVSIAQPSIPIRSMADLMNSNIRFAISVIDSYEMVVYAKNDSDFTKLFDICNMSEHSKISIIQNYTGWDFDVSYIRKK